MRSHRVLVETEISNGGIYLDFKGDSVIRKHDYKEMGEPRPIGDMAGHLKGTECRKPLLCFWPKALRMI